MYIKKIQMQAKTIKTLRQTNKQKNKHSKFYKCSDYKKKLTKKTST